MAGLSTPLHLGSSLLALFAAAGLAIMLLSRPGRTAVPRLERSVVVTGALAIAAAHILAGALIEGVGDATVWLRTGGLLAIALGLSMRHVGRLAGAAALVPITPVPAAALAVGAGLVGGIRGVLGGLRTVLLGLGLLAWGAAEPLTHYSVTAAAWVTIIGAVAIGGWLWQASTAHVLAKFVTASVGSLLAAVVLIAVVLSGVGSGELVNEELRRLRDFSTRLANEISDPRDNWTIQSTSIATVAARTEFLLPLSEEGLASLHAAWFNRQGQDFVIVLDSEGRIHAEFSPVAELRTEAFLSQIQGTEQVTGVVRTRDPSPTGGIITVAAKPVAFGVGPIVDERNETAGWLVTGRRADDLWARQEAGRLGVNVIVASGGEVGAATVPAATAAAIVDFFAAGQTQGTLQIADSVVYAAAATVRDPDTGAPIAQIISVSSADVIAQVEAEQARRLFLLALLGALLAGLVAAAVTGRLVAPIRRLTAAAAAVREGNLDVRTDIDSPDEVGDLGRTFNEMTTALREQAGQLREAAAVQSRLRARLEAMTASMSDALVAVDPAGHVITFNPAAERLVGRAAVEVLGLPLGQVIVGRGPAEQTAAHALGAADSSGTAAVQLLLETSSGRLVPTAATAAPVHDAAGEPLGRVLVLRDVTREAEVERMKSEFLSNVSHELRTPLTPIKGYAEVLARRSLSREETRQFAAQILTSAARLERIVRTIVDFAALDSGKLEMRRHPCELGDIVDEVLADWRRRHPERDFRRRLAKDLPCVLVDERMVQRCLDELLDNAVKFSPEGGPISVAAQLHDPSVGNGRPMVRLSVRDRGVGIEPETAARIFSDFYQVDASETRHYGGLGLGLALVRRIIDRLGGDVRVESAPGAGSTVHLLLPVAEDRGSGQNDSAARRQRRASARRQ